MKGIFKEFFKFVLPYTRNLLLAVVAVNPLCVNLSGDSAEAGGCYRAYQSRVVNFDLSTSRPIPKAVHGANQNWFALFPITHNLIKEAINKLGFTQIRFPGGTVGNYYDWVKFAPDWQAIETLPDVPEHVIGSRPSFEEQVVTLRPYTFYKTLEGIGKETTFMVNVYLNTPEEITSSLKRLKDNGMIIKRLEMGNEMFNPRYDLTVGEYLNRAYQINQAAKQMFPGVKIGVVVDHDIWNNGSQYNWDLPDRGWYDAVIVHPLFGSRKELWQSGQRQEFIEWVTQGRGQHFQNFVARVKERYPKKELWLTEWNMVEKNEEVFFTNTYTHAYYVYDFLLQALKEPIITVANNQPMFGKGIHESIFSPRQEFVNEYFSFPPKMVPVGDDRGVYTFDWFFFKHATFWPLAWIGRSFNKYQDLAVGTLPQTLDCYSGEDVTAVYFFNKTDPVRGSYALINKTGSPIKIVLSGTISIKRQFKLAILKKAWDLHSLEGAEFEPVQNNVTSDEIVLPAYSLAYLAFVNTIPPLDCGTQVGCTEE